MDSSINEILKSLHVSLVAKIILKEISTGPIDMQKFWIRFLNLIHTSAYLQNREKGPVILVLNTAATGGTVDALKPEYLQNWFDTGLHTKNNVIYIDHTGCIINVNSPYAADGRLESISDVTEDSTLRGAKHLHIFIHGNEIDFMTNGKIFHSIVDIFGAHRLGSLKGKSPVSSYRDLIMEHYDKEIVGQKGLLYWAKKGEWLLKAKPEQDFRKRLWAFLQENISNGRVDEECLNAGTTDRTDVRILETLTGKVFVIEVKWLGKSVGSKAYDGQGAHDRANSGINQLTQYVREDAKCTKGVLVIYDARKDKFTIAWAPPKHEWDARLDQEPILLELDATSASDRADESVKENKIKKKNEGK